MSGMQKNRTVIVGAVSGIVSAALAGVGAQTINDLESAVTQGAQYGEAQEQIEQFMLPPQEESMLDGEPGVFLLNINDIFQIGAAAGYGYSTNPGRSLDINTEESAFSNFAVSAGVNTVINGQVDAGANITLSGTDYSEGNELDNKNAIASAYVGKNVLNDRLYLTAGASYGVNGNSSFDEQREFYGASFSASTIFKPSRKFIVRPALTVARQLSDNDALDHTAVTAGARAVWAPSANWRFSGDVNFTTRSFDNFYEDVTFVEREDETWSAGLAVSRKVTDEFDVTASVSYTDQSSEFFLSEYEATDGGLNLRLSKRF